MNSSELKFFDGQSRKQFIFEFLYYLNFLSALPFQQKFQRVLRAQMFFIWYAKYNLFCNFNTTASPKYRKLNVNFFLHTPSNTIPATNFRFKNFPEQKTFQFKLYFFSKIISLLFLFNSYVLEASTKLHSSYKLLFGRRISATLWINNNRFVHTWFNSFSFIYNVFYFNLSPLIFGSHAFKKEILAFNWKFFHSDLILWKFSFSFFIFKTNSFSKKIDFFYKKIYTLGVDFLFLTDSFYHIKNLYYFNKYKIFTLGLVSGAMDPWLVSFAVPGLVNGFLTEFFFLKNIVFLLQHSSLTKYIFFKKNYVLFSLASVKVA